MGNNKEWSLSAVKAVCLSGTNSREIIGNLAEWHDRVKPLSLLDIAIQVTEMGTETWIVFYEE